MGANFVIQSIGLKAHADGSVDERWAKSAFSQARHAIAAIDQAKLTQISDEHGIAYHDVEGYQRDLQKCLAEVEQAVLGDHRQAAIVDGGGGIVLLLAGGMSWGDPPTELFEAISRLHEANVLPDARR